MRTKYLLHPGEYAVGENEKFYAGQAAKGWLLDKRGTYLSRFRKGEPARLKYRVELSAAAPLLWLEDEIRMPMAQIDLYESCGWTLVASRHIFHVFSAPEDSDAPEFYSQPEQQAETLNALRRSYRVSWVVLAVMLALIAAITLLVQQDRTPAELLRGVQAEFVMRLVRLGLAGLFNLFWFGLAWYLLIYGGVRTWLLYRRLKRGEPLDHAPRTKHWAHRLVLGIFCVGILASTLSIPVLLASIRTRNLPPESDGPYLVLSDLGVEGARSEGYHESNTVETCRSLFAAMWRTGEFVSVGNGDWVHLDQDVYRLPTPELARAVVPSVLERAVFGGFQPVEAAGLDGAWEGSVEYVAVKGEWIWDVTVIGGDRVSREDVFRALAELAEGY